MDPTALAITIEDGYRKSKRHDRGEIGNVGHVVSYTTEGNIPNNAKARMITTANKVKTKMTSRTGIIFSVKTDGEKRFD